MAKFLRESNFNKALTDRTVVYESHVRMFWRSVRYDEKENMIYSTVQKKDKNNQDVDIEVKFNVGDLRRVLELRDSDNDPTIIPERLWKGLWYRMGFGGHVNGKYLKSLFSPPYKFLIHCTLDYIVNIITCLVLNRPYNVSQVLFDHLVNNIRGEKYIMYPRFIQMIIDDQVFDIPKDPTNVLGLRHVTDETLGRLTTYKGLKKDESELRARRMICKIANLGYVAPENDAWRHDNNNSENEDDRLRDMHEKKLQYWFVKDGKRKRTPNTSPAVSSPKVSMPKIVVKGPSRESQPRLVDELVLDPSEDLQQGPEGVAHTDSSDADDESTETESEIERIGVGKVQLK
ncbi:hypothetical protein Hanom_Chr03g00202191 [Helianthus anomalus]